jgi:hypothetical protein
MDQANAAGNAARTGDGFNDKNICGKLDEIKTGLSGKKDKDFKNRG